MKIWIKLSLVIVAIILVVVSALGLIVLQLMQKTLVDNAMTVCRSSLNNFATIVQKNFEDEQFITLKEVAASYRKIDGLEYIAFHRYKGRQWRNWVHSDERQNDSAIADAAFRKRLDDIRPLEASVWEKTSMPVPGTEQYGHVNDDGKKDTAEIYRFFRPVVVKLGDRQITVGVVSLGYSKAFIDGKIAQTRNLLLLIAGIVMVLGIGFGNVFSGRLVRPIERLSSAVNQVAAGDLGIELPVTSRDEIGTLGRNFNAMIISLREKLQMEKFVSKSTAEMISTAVKDGKGAGVQLGGERRRQAVLFADVRGFTSMSEKLEPEAVVEILNQYLNLQAEAIVKNSGDIDKFVGDEVMGVFNRQRGMADDALLAALEMQRVVAKANEERVARDLPPIQIGIGINIGDVVVGNIGSKGRMDFTSIGDTVNLAARLCSAANPGEIIVTEDVIQAAKRKYKGRRLDPVVVKGKQKPIKIFRVSGVEK